MSQHLHFPVTEGRRSIKAFFIFLNVFYTYSRVIDRHSHSARCTVCNKLLREPKGIEVYIKICPFAISAAILAGALVFTKSDSFVFSILVIYFAYVIPYAAILEFGEWTIAQKQEESEAECKKRLTYERREANKDLLLNWWFWAILVLSFASLFIVLSSIR